MTQEELKNLLDKLRALPAETEWVEFKEIFLKSSIHVIMQIRRCFSWMQ